MGRNKYTMIHSIRTGEYKQLISLALKLFRVNNYLNPLINFRYFVKGFLIAKKIPITKVLFLIYTPGKVGTASLYYALANSKIPVFHTHSHLFAKGFYFFYKYFRNNTKIIAVSGKRPILDQAISDFCQNVSNYTSPWYFDFPRHSETEISDFFLEKLPFYKNEKSDWTEKQLSIIFENDDIETRLEGPLTIIQNKRNLQLWLFNFQDISASLHHISKKIFVITNCNIEINHLNASSDKSTSVIKDIIHSRLEIDETYRQLIDSVLDP